MRVLAVCLGVAILFAAFTVFTAIKTTRDRDHVDPFEVHAPDSDDERAAARTAEQFSAAVARNDAAAVCRLAVGEIARQLRCSSRPRLLTCRGARAFHAKEDGDFVDVYLDQCHLHVAKHPQGWRVTEYIPLVGYA
jgi:hypothetical protein